MFLKPFKIKTNTAIKGSDRKKLRCDLSRHYSELTTDNILSLVPNKEEMSVVKLLTANGATIVVYCQQKNPIFFELDNVVLPTVYTLWQFPDMLLTFTTHSAVLEKLRCGADLMLPGIITNKEYHPKMYGVFEKSEPCAVNFVTNKAPIAVGQTALSSSDMFLSGKRGKGVIILHSYLDHLWEMGDKSSPTILPPPFPLDPNTDEIISEAVDSNPSLVTCEGNLNDQDIKIDNDDCQRIEHLIDSIHIVNNNSAADENGEKTSTDDAVSMPQNEESLKTPAEVMDELLRNCFLHSLKKMGKHLDLPVLTSTFYKTCMLPCCPVGKTLDVKKSSHKKLSKFLQEMKERNLIDVKELSKGVESITAINFSHTELKSFVIPDNENTEVKSEETTSSLIETAVYEPPEVVEMFTVTAAVSNLFKTQGISKGSYLTSNDIRKIIKDYVKTNNLQSIKEKGMVDLDPILTDALIQRKETIEKLSWEALLTRCVEKMKPAYKMTFPGQSSILKKGNLEPVTMSISQRSGNKKVTLVNNLESFGIDAHEFAHKVQIGVATSTSVYTAPNKKEGNEVLVQGNQINFIAKLLLDDYRLPKKYIVGLENAPKKGKKR